jgi:hypothetical protein
MQKRIGFILFVFLLVILTVPPWAIWAQATAGYTKVNTAPITTTTFTTGALAPGVWNFEITAVNAAGESGPSKIVTGTATAAASHATLSWVTPVADASHGAPDSYNVYSQQVIAPNPPGAPTLTFN